MRSGRRSCLSEPGRLPRSSRRESLARFSRSRIISDAAGPLPLPSGTVNCTLALENMPGCSRILTSTSSSVQSSSASPFASACSISLPVLSMTFNVVLQMSSAAAAYLPLGSGLPWRSTEAPECPPPECVGTILRVIADVTRLISKLIVEFTTMYSVNAAQ